MSSSSCVEDSGDDVRRERVEDFGGEAAGAAHPLVRFRAVKLDDAVAGFDAVVGGDRDILSHGANIGTGGRDVEPD